MLTVTLYGKPDCHLCDDVKHMLAALQERYPHRLVEIDISQNPVLQRELGAKIPVLEVGPYRLEAPIDEKALLVTLGAAWDRVQRLEAADDADYRRAAARGSQVTRADRFALWFSRHWLALVNLLVFLYVGLPFAAPVMMKVGWTTPAKAIYTVYSPLCHQLGFRSWFLFGAQPFYPREAAGIEGVATFGEATGLDESALLPARQFVGNEQVGYKVALCERDVAIYGAIFLFGLFYAATGRRLKPLPLLWWVVIGWLPIGLDGFSQLFGQSGIPALIALFPYRESTPLLRTVTGLLFGWTTAWFAFPVVEETMRDLHQLMVRKFASVKARENDAV